MTRSDFDIIVIGGGHAGAEAAWAAAQLGARTALVTYDVDAIGRLSCNPAVGGIGKGQIVREIDALGGLMGRVTDEAGIQFRMLNRSKGPAVWAPRAQTDSRTYPAVLRRWLQSHPNITLVAAGVEAFITAGNSRDNFADATTATGGNGCASGANVDPAQRLVAVQLDDGRRLPCGAAVLASGTFLRGLMHTGTQQTVGGRIGERAATNLSDVLRRLGLRLGRLKTGTPPRVARNSVDFSRLREQPGDDPPAPFSFMTDRITQPQVCCWLTATNAAIHELIRNNLDRAPLYSGQIVSTGPRYCPSIETKVMRFPEKTSHQVFLEPEGRDSERIYVNGISTSLPRDIQAAMVAAIPGLERAQIVQWGYAVEYDFVFPEQVDASLAVRRVAGLYLAGQILGTSGYEEAAGQGIVAGINAARFVARQAPVTLGRDQAYIGVMIDDLVTRGVEEPYRMFTSRAEHRLHLRYDNADARLTPLGREIGVITADRWERFRKRQADVEAALTAVHTIRIGGRCVRDWLRRPEEDGAQILADCPELAALATPDVWARVLVEVKYEGYLQRQARALEQFRSLEDRRIPAGIDYGSILHLRHEAIERWSVVRPSSIGQAARVSGVHPTDVNVLLVHLAAQE